MALTQEEAQNLLNEVAQSVPAMGILSARDRADAFQKGLEAAVTLIAARVTLDAPKEGGE